MGKMFGTVRILGVLLLAFELVVGARVSDYLNVPSESVSDLNQHMDIFHGQSLKSKVAAEPSHQSFSLQQSNLIRDNSIGKDFFTTERLQGLSDRMEQLCQSWGKKIPNICSTTYKDVFAGVTELAASTSNDLGIGSAYLRSHPWGFAYLFYGAVLSGYEFMMQWESGQQFRCWFAELVDRIADALGAHLVFDRDVCFPGGASASVMAGCRKDRARMRTPEIGELTVCFGSFLTACMNVASSQTGVDVVPLVAFFTEMLQTLQGVDNAGAGINRLLTQEFAWKLCFSLLKLVIFFSGGGYMGPALASLLEPKLHDAWNWAARYVTTDYQRDLPTWVQQSPQGDSYLTSLGNKCVWHVSRAIEKQMAGNMQPQAMVKSGFKFYFSDEIQRGIKHFSDWDNFLLHPAVFAYVGNKRKLFFANNGAVINSRYSQIFKDGIISTAGKRARCTSGNDIMASLARGGSSAVARAKTWACLAALTACNGYSPGLIYRTKQDYVGSCKETPKQSSVIESHWRLKGAVAHCFGVPQCFKSAVCDCGVDRNGAANEWPFTCL